MIREDAAVLAQLEAERQSEDAATLARADAAREEFPDGTYARTGGKRPDPQAADHVQALLEGLDGWCLGGRAKHPWPPPPTS